MRALFLTKYSAMGGSSKHMVYSYLEFYRQAGIDCVVAPLFDDRYFCFRRLEKPVTVQEVVGHAGYFVERFVNRIAQVIAARDFDLVLVEKEILPYVPYGLEGLMKRRRIKLVSLYDDAVYAYYQNHPSFPVRVMCRNKIQRVMQASDHVIVWNSTLAQNARRFNPNVSVVNTGIDLRRYRVKDDRSINNNDPIVIGWMGTPNSFPYLRALDPAFQQLARRYSIELRVVSSIDYASPGVKVSNRRWSHETEVDDLCSFDIGIMPMNDDAWARGKSGYKAVQYMGVGIPAVCSPIGVVTEIVQDGASGFLASTTSDWLEKLACLIANPELRRQQGRAGRRAVETTYSIQAVALRLVGIVKSVVEAC